MLPVETSGWVLLDLYIVDDPADPSTLPSGAFDLPLVIADRQFDAKNQIPYVFNPNGVTGDKFLVNGVYQPYLEVGDRKYRFRILNASNFRTYFLELSSATPSSKLALRAVCFPHLLRALACAWDQQNVWTSWSISPVNSDKTSIWWMC